MRAGRQTSPMDIHAVVEKLIGPIDPVGESRVDGKRFENLELLLDLTYDLLRDIADVASNQDRCEHSISKAGKEAQKFLNEIPEEFNIDL